MADAEPRTGHARPPSPETEITSCDACSKGYYCRFEEASHDLWLPLIVVLTSKVSIALVFKVLSGYYQYHQRTDEHACASKVKYAVQAPREDMCCEERRDDTEQPSPAARQTACCASYRSGKGLGCPAIEHRIEHTLEEVHQPTDPDVFRGAVDDREDEKTRTKKCRGYKHSGPSAVVHC